MRLTTLAEQRTNLTTFSQICCTSGIGSPVAVARSGSSALESERMGVMAGQSAGLVGFEQIIVRIIP
jgi:hypothetical protein